MIRIFLGLFVLLIGISALTGFDFFKYLFALFLIVFGIGIITGRGLNFAKWNKKTSENTDFIDEVAIFSPVNKTLRTENFSGAELVMVFAGGEIDLSKAKTKKKTVDMEIVAIFGGAKIIFPKDWKVNLQGTAVLGGYDNKVGERGNDKVFKNGVVVNIKGVVIFGGLEITN
jgi:predicted membrane protein